jgi:hypothetical protein
LDEQIGETDIIQAAVADTDIGWLSVSANERHTSGVTTFGSVECWGLDSYGRSSPSER